MARKPPCRIGHLPSVTILIYRFGSGGTLFCRFTGPYDVTRAAIAAQ